MTYKVGKGLEYRFYPIICDWGDKSYNIDASSVTAIQGSVNPFDVNDAEAYQVDLSYLSVKASGQP